jgi:hypothetical protein
LTLHDSGFHMDNFMKPLSFALGALYAQVELVDLDHILFLILTNI